MQLVPELLQYVTEVIRRVEHKVEIIEDNQCDFVCKLDNMTRKQEMVLTKQSTLHGDTTVFQSPASSVLAGGITPPFTSPTSTVRSFPPFPVPVRTPAANSTSAVSDIFS